ncbi:MAG: S24/S26 family peptidase [Planctomycetota bacterium]
MHPLVGEWLDAAGGRIRVKGLSMWPLYLDGEIVDMVPADASDVRVGDVVVMKLDTHLRVHRLVNWRPDGLRTAGDALRLPDPWQDPAACVGRLRTPAGWRYALDALLRVLTPLRTGFLK